MLIERIIEYLRDMEARDPAFHVVSDPGAMAPDATLEAESFAVGRARVVEGAGRFFTRPVPWAVDRASGFTHFLDGIQKSRLVGYQGIVPVVYGYTAAVIRERGTDRRLRVWREPVVVERLYAPIDEIDAAAFEARGVEVRDTTRNMPAGDGAHPLRYRQAALTAIQRDRADAESRLARRWVQDAQACADTWLLVDGSLTFATQHARIAGVVKSHQTQYFPPEDQSRVLRLPVGERTAVFQPGFGEAQAGDVYSWYLRLHPFAGRDLTHGLIRVEVDRHASAADEADRWSAWMMVERQPLSTPDQRWDKLFYPIRDCEEYLRSIAPTGTMMEAVLGS